MRARVYYRFSSVALVALAALNGVLAFIVYRGIGKSVVNNIRIVEPPDYSSLTNLPPVVPSSVPGFPSSPAPFPSPKDSSPVPASPSEYLYAYSFFSADGRNGAYLNGRYVYSGDRTSFGIVRDVFPERIFFDDGSYISNTMKYKENNAYVRNSAADSVGTP